MRKSGTTNPQLSELVQELKTLSMKQGVKLWKRIAEDLERPLRNRRAVNIAKINTFTKEGEAVIVPGKVLGSGELSHGLTVAAYSFSDSARSLIEKKNGKAISIRELMQQNPAGSNIRIIG